MAVKWRFVDFEKPDGTIPVRVWEDAAPADAQADFVTTVRHLSVTEEWTDKDGAKTLTGDHAPLTELLIDFTEWPARAAKGKKRRFRPIGFKDEKKGQFILFGGCEKVGGVLDPLSTFDDALKSYEEWRRGLGKVHDREL